MLNIHVRQGSSLSSTINYILRQHDYAVPLSHPDRCLLPTHHLDKPGEVWQDYITR